MPIVLRKTYDIPKKYDEKDQEMYKDLIDQFRLRIGDDIPHQNILYEKCLRYRDRQVISFLEAALADINGFGSPATTYSMRQMYKQNESLLLLGAIVCMLVREGLFQAANQIDFSDSGLSIGMYNKTGIYQSWYGALLQTYQNEKTEFKRSEIAQSPNAGFIGISSEFSYRGSY